VSTKSKKTLVTSLYTFCLVSIALVWLSSGIYKLLHIDEFETIIRAHDILPRQVYPYLVAVPVIEIALGISVGVVVEIKLLKLILGISSVLTGIFLVYILLVPADTIKSVGCGCGGIAVVAQQGPWGPTAGHIGFLVSVLLAHIVVYCTPITALGRSDIMYDTLVSTRQRQSDM